MPITPGLLPVPLASAEIEVIAQGEQWMARAVNMPATLPVVAAHRTQAVEEMGLVVAEELAKQSSGSLLNDGCPLFDLEPTGVSSRHTITIFRGERTGPVLRVWDEAEEARLLLSRQALPLWWAGKCGLDLEAATALAEVCATEPKLLSRMNAAFRAVRAAAPEPGRKPGDGGETLKVATLLFRELHDCEQPGKPRRIGVSIASAAKLVQATEIGRRYGDHKSIVRLWRDERLQAEARANVDVWPNGAETAG